MANIFDQLPEGYAILKPAGSVFKIGDVNEAYRRLTEIDIESARDTNWDIPLASLFDDSALDEIRSSLSQAFDSGYTHRTKLLTSQKRESSASAIWVCEHIPVPQEKGKVQFIIQRFVPKSAGDEGPASTADRERQSQKTLHERNESLVDQINRKSVQYEAASRELNDFIYSVSHDLRAPLRRIDGFSQELINEYSDQLDETGAHYLRRVRQGAQDMGNLIDDLLKLSRISRKSLELERVDLSTLAREVFGELMEFEKEREVGIRIEDTLEVTADKGLLRVMLSNLLSNALKFSQKEKKALIEIGACIRNSREVYFIKDNGVGFDPEYSDKLFKAFDRLHSNREFAGTGIGLATVKRIVSRHGGEIWGESTPGKGATFYFKLQSG